MKGLGKTSLAETDAFHSQIAYTIANSSAKCDPFNMYLNLNFCWLQFLNSEIEQKLVIVLMSTLRK